MRQQAVLKDQKVNKLVKISVLTAFALVLQLLDFPLPIFPEFLKMDLSDLPALLGAFAMGPASGVIIQAMKNILHTVLKPSTLGIGELANFVVGAAFVYTAAVVYLREKNRTHALYGLIAGTIAMTIIAAIGNYFVFLPLYEKVLGFPMSAVIGAGAKVNPAIKDLNTFIILSIMPFNIIKAILVSIAAFLSYKRISPMLHK